MVNFTEAGATFDPNRIYRYRLWREWSPLKPTVAFLMLNPSTADEHVLDPTLRRCLGFAQVWGYGRMEIINLFALRATNPKQLYTHPYPEGPENDSWISLVASRAEQVVCGWGTHGEYRDRATCVALQLIENGVPMFCLGTTKGGMPKHPLYLSNKSERKSWTLTIHRPLSSPAHGSI
jgi:hypothetical protein